MATIQDTLEEIPKFQKNIQLEIDSLDSFDTIFCSEIMNFTTCYYFDLLSHSCMNHLPQNVNIANLPSAYKKYVNETRDLTIYKEIVRFQNISGLFISWSYFEQFIYRTVGNGSSTRAGDFEKSHKKLLSTGIKRDRAKAIINIFSGIRRTRNSLHENGLYTSGTKEFNFEVQGKKYVLKPGEQVTPIRLLDLLNEMWNHYKEIKILKTKANKK